MKTILYNPILPLAVMIITAIGALQGHGQQGKTKALVHGYINTIDGACLLSDLCSTSGEQVCTVGYISGGTRLWGKNANGVCILQLYRPEL